MSKDKHDSKTTDAFGDLMDESQIKAILKERGWTQKEVAKYFGRRPEWVSRLIKNNDGSRGRMHDCMFNGLPKKTSDISQLLLD
jgi:predicted transcriptional regulator